MPILVLGIGVGAGPDQSGDDLGILVVSGRLVQGSRACLIPCIRVGARFYQDGDEFGIFVVHGRLVQGSHPVLILGLGVYPGLE